MKIPYGAISYAWVQYGRQEFRDALVGAADRADPGYSHDPNQASDETIDEVWDLYAMPAVATIETLPYAWREIGRREDGREVEICFFTAKACSLLASSGDSYARRFFASIRSGRTS